MSEVEVVFRNIAAQPTLDAAIRSGAERLNASYPGIIACRVVVEVPRRHPQHGNTVHVRIELSLPGKEIMVSHGPAQRPVAGERRDDGQEAADALAATAVREAFDVARRRLEDACHRDRGAVTHHALS